MIIELSGPRRPVILIVYILSYMYIGTYITKTKTCSTFFDMTQTRHDNLNCHTTSAVSTCVRHKHSVSTCILFSNPSITVMYICLCFSYFLYSLEVGNVRYVISINLDHSKIYVLTRKKTVVGWGLLYYVMAPNHIYISCNLFFFWGNFLQS